MRKVVSSVSRSCRTVYCAESEAVRSIDALSGVSSTLPRRQPPVYTSVRRADLFRAARGLISTAAAEAALSDAHAALREIYSTRQVALTQSGTAALVLALRATAKSSNNTIALPAYCCPDIGAAAVFAGFRIVLYDVDPLTLEPDSDDIARCVDFGATHLLVAHLCGRIVDFPAFSALADRLGLVLIEDAAQHAGGTLRGVRAGSLARIAILSFGRGKGLNAGGGGAVLFDPMLASIKPLPSAARHARQAIGCAVAAVSDVLSHPSLFWLPSSVPALRLGETFYRDASEPEAINPAYARLLESALHHERATLAARRRNEVFYDEALRDGEKVTKIRSHSLSSSGALRYPVLIDAKLATTMTSLGVARLYPRLLDAYEQIRAVLVGSDRHYPGSARLAQQLHTLPTHELLTADERARIVGFFTAS